MTHTGYTATNNITNPKHCGPLFLASSIAAKVSAVSPLCERWLTLNHQSKTGLRYLNSEAYSTSTGIRARSSKRYSATNPMPTCSTPYDNKAVYSFEFILVFFDASHHKLPFSASKRPLKESKIDLGCSKISFGIKCSKPPFSSCSTPF